ncbi:hypothetical protein BX659_1327 [Orenia metallireducens]|uniref:Uncharacterized protein n=1 Tax=Orenia metallireducens TaxID=1413210 RepID=A0A285IA89_9FIRM|nr:hypothetical protein [Orenia metallireducens]PRX21209.1 hypothetical protein BX659_1327 [Orenia metallireducens]SNY44878.1 hypothetical protein SAMN06265827_1367 [Orenia metallireducens]
MTESSIGLIRENIKAKFDEMEEQNLDFISEFIRNNGQYQKFDNYVVFRLFNAVSEREEVFIGNVLFNDYISKLLLRLYEEKKKDDGKIELVYNDLENFYYIVKQDDIEKFSLEELEKDFKDYFAENLEELFFADEDLERGIYGKIDNLLLCQGYNYLSLPLTILPKFLEEEFKKNMIEKGKANYTIEDNFKLFTQYFNVSTMNYENQSLQSFISKLLINNEITDIELFKDVVEFNYDTDFKFDLLVKVISYNNKIKAKDKKVIKNYLNDKLDFKEMKDKLIEVDLNNCIINFIKQVKEENNFVSIVELFIKISSNQKLISQLKKLKNKFDLLEVNELTKKPKGEYSKYIKYYFETERYSIELLNFLQRFVDSLKKSDKKEELIIEIMNSVANCWEIVKELNETKEFLDYFAINISDMENFFKEFFKQNSIYKVIFNDYLEIKSSVPESIKEKLLDSIKSCKIAEKVTLLIDIERESYSKIIFPQLTQSIALNKNNSKNKCFICFKKSTHIIARNVITGFESFKFVNQEATIENHKKICVSCGIYLWLKLKYLGSYYSGNVFPEKRNLVFFYGQIPQERINKIQGILNSLYYCTQKPSVYTHEMINDSIGELEQENSEGKSPDVDDLLQELIDSDKENKKEKPVKVPPTIWSWYKNGQQNDKVNTHIFSLGQGQNKLYTFVLPYALNRSDGIQKKFSQNRVSVYSMLSFLSSLAGVKGSFYYLSTPKLTDEINKENFFYYKDKRKEDSLKEYELLTEVAWKLINPQSVSGRTFMDRQENAFKKRLKLARDLENLPLITISKIYRELLGDNKGSNYNNLSNIWNRKVSSPNLFPLIKISNKIRKEVDFMGQKIDTQKLKAFTEDLFSQLVLISGVFPKNFHKAPTEFEKYPRLLIKKILKYDAEEGKDVLAGYREWSTKILHSAKGFYDKDKKKIAEITEEIKKSVVKNEKVLSKKSNLLYLKRSLFGWITEFLYPLYSLVEEINLNIEIYKEDEINQVKDSDKLNKIKQKFEDMNYDFEKNFEIAKEVLLNNTSYYKKSKK